MKVLVTGGGGFVGGRVVDRLLARGCSVRSFGRSPQPGLVRRGVDVYCGDLADADAVSKATKGVDAVFHVAARAGVWGDWKSFFEPNVMGTRNVIMACRQHGVPHLVYTSTPSVVFNRQPIRGGDESMPYGRGWLCHYAHTKAIAEEEALAADSSELRVVALRPHLVYGPGDPHLLPRVVESVAAGRLKIVGNGKNRVDVSYVENVADAHLQAFDALVEGRVSGKAFFISDGQPVELWPWLNGILRGLGQPELKRKVPLPLAYIAGGVAECLWQWLRRPGEPPITRFVAVELAKDHYFSIRAAREAFGYDPVVPMEEAVSTTIDDLRARGFGSKE